MCWPAASRHGVVKTCRWCAVDSERFQPHIAATFTIGICGVNPDIVVYTTPVCPYCVAAKQLLKRKGAAFREIDVAADAALRQEVMQRSGRRTVPQIWIGEYHVGGFDDLNALERAGRLDALLAGGS